MKIDRRNKVKERERKWNAVEMDRRDRVKEREIKWIAVEMDGWVSEGEGQKRDWKGWQRGG